MIEAFVSQLQVMGDTSDALRQLFDAGHTDYQQGYVHDRPLCLDAKQSGAAAELKDLTATAQTWQRCVKESRDRFFYLNFYT